MTTNADLAKQVGRLVNLESVVVRSADLDATFDPVNLPDQLTLESEYRSTYSVDAFPDGRKRLNVIIEFKFQCGSPDSEEGPGEPALTLASTFLLVYALNADVEIDEQCFSHFANLNGAYNVWPYWREFVQSATTRAGLPGVIVPLFRPPVRELAEEELPAALCLGSEALAISSP